MILNSQRPRRWAVFGGFLVATTILAACAGGKDISVGDTSTTNPTGSPTNSPSGPSFVTDVYPLFASKACNSATACHQGASPSGIVNLGGGSATAADAFTSITGTSGVVDTGTPANSLLLKKPLTGDPTSHTGGKQFASTSDAAYTTILQWIQAGAPNN